jgi:hypothetical protein
MRSTNQLLLFTCCLLILISMAYFINEQPYVSKEAVESIKI